MRDVPSDESADDSLAVDSVESDPPEQAAIATPSPTRKTPRITLAAMKVPLPFQEAPSR
jgi:hypothetical protein